MKILKHRNLLGCLFAVILAMPLIQVGVRCAYTIFNKNAYESYSDVVINKKIQIVNNNEFVANKIYEYVYVDKQSNATSPRISFKSLSFDFYEKYPEAPVQNYDSFLVTGINNTIYWYYGESRWTGAGYAKFNFSFTSNGEIGSGNSFTNFNIFTYTGIANSLDNVFEYSINKITENNNIGDLHFFTWFADLFLDLDNSANALYINFINWYFNYALLVSVVYILFLVLMWFIQFVRKLLEKGMDFGQRGY